jgi:peptide chain release factor 1
MRLDNFEEMEARFVELEKLISSPDVARDPAKLAVYAKEHGALARVVNKYRAYKDVLLEIEEAEAIISEDDDAELVELAKEELESAETERAKALDVLKETLVSESRDSLKNAIVEIRAGTGGGEAALFAADIFKMYSRYAEKMKWKIDIIDSSPTDLGGLKEITLEVTGAKVYHYLQYESGGHRVQRVPVTEGGGRIHTSAVTVAVLPEAEEVEVHIDQKDLRIDRMRAGGPGGQSVNKTSSAIRVTHEPSGLVVQCQDEKSQHKNLAKAMKVLRSRLYEKIEREKAKERGDERKSLIGSGDRSERIRTYNFPQNRVTDHRINLTLYNLEGILQGDMDELIKKLLEYDKELKLRSL